MKICANLCQPELRRPHQRLPLSALTMALLVSVACDGNDTMSTSLASVGGSETQGGNSGSAGITETNAGGPNSPAQDSDAGSAGGPAQDASVESPTSDCINSTMTVEEYCSASNNCDFDFQNICFTHAFDASWQRGCGYVRLSWVGDVGDRGTTIWEEATGKLVYDHFTQWYSPDCTTERTVGNEPECSTWSDFCDRASSSPDAGTDDVDDTSDDALLDAGVGDAGNQ